MKKWILSIAIAVEFTLTGNAALQVYTNKAEFLSTTLATNCTGPLPNLGEIPGELNGRFTAGIVTFSISLPHPRASLYSQNWTALLPGNEIAIDGVEDLNANFATPIYSGGFDFVDRTIGDAGCPGLDSTFKVTLYNGGTAVDEFTFNASNDVMSFVGIHSSAPFTRLDIRETPGGCENDFFGQFYCGSIPLGCPPARIRLSEVEVCWPSESNQLYQVDYRSSVTTNAWIPLFTNILGNGMTNCVYDKIDRGQPQRFYRIVCP